MRAPQLGHGKGKAKRRGSQAGLPAMPSLPQRDKPLSRNDRRVYQWAKGHFAAETAPRWRVAVKGLGDPLCPRH